MKKLTRLLLFLVSSSFAQQPLCTAEIHTLQSEILHEKRIIDIQLPKNYYNTDFAKATYPILYILDGENNFPFISALERFNTKFLYRSQPEMIIVGIRNTDRTRDFTPTKMEKFKTSGGAENFTDFIEKELQPYVNKHFRINGFNILWGHSFGGLFALNTLLNRPYLFKSYIAIDPSFWWNNQFLLNEFDKKWFSIKLKYKKSLFVGNSPINPNRKELFPEGVKVFETLFFTKNTPKNCRFSFKDYNNCDHGSVPIPATLDAITFLFEGMKLPVKQVPKNPDLIRKNYKKLSEKLGFTVIPDESLIHQFIEFLTKIENKKAVKEILNYGLELYPDSKFLKENSYNILD